MGKAVAADVLDAALAEVATATRLVLCSGQPANFAGIAAVALGEVALGPGDLTLSDGDTSGRKLRVAEQEDVPVDASGTLTHLALDDGARLMYVTTCASQALTDGGSVDVGVWDIEFGGVLTGGGVSLVIASALHSHVADSLALLPKDIISVQDALHAHAADNAVLSISGELRSDLVVALNWSTGTGSGSSAMLDSGKSKPFTLYAGSANANGDIVSATGLSFPAGMTNVYRILVNAAGQTFVAFDDSDAYFATPGVGDSIYWRGSFRLVVPDGLGVDNQIHGIVVGPQYNLAVPGQVWSYRMNVNDSGGYTMALRTDANLANPGTLFLSSYTLAKNHTYTWMVRMHVTSEGNWTPDIRWYDESGTLVSDGDDYYGSGGSPGTYPLTEIPIAGSAGAAGARGWANGVEGYAGGLGTGWPGGPRVLGYMGGLAVFTDDWPDFFNSLEESF